MKKTLALLVCLAMLVTALSVNVFAATTPTVEVVTHESTASGDATFAIKLSGFDSLKGLDLTVTGDEGVEFTGASALNTQSALAANENYVISADKHTLHIVELSNDLNGDIITVAAKVNVDGASHNVAVTGQFAKSGKELYDDVTFTPGEITPFVKPSEVEIEVEAGEQVKVEQNTAGEGYFIPFGAVYNGTFDAPEYLDKDENGAFANVTADTTVVKFPIPANGFGTYGISDGKVNSMIAKQFGNYVAEYSSAKTYGTFAIMGDWAAYRDYYLSKKGYTDAQLVEMLYARYKEKKESGYTNNYVTFGANSNEYIIQVTAVQQNNFLWRSADKLEYGVRFLNVLSDREYAAVAYYTEGDSVTFAKEIRTEK